MRWNALSVVVAGMLLMLAAAAIFAGSATGVMAEAPPRVEEPAGFRNDRYRAPVPETLEGARVVDTLEAETIWNEASAVFIDVFPQAPKPPGLPADTIWRAPKHESIAGATWLANVGYGVIRPEVEAFFKTELERLGDGSKDKPLVFFCLRDCWMSWNAAKRAVLWGYTNVIWFPDGTDGWKDFDLPTVKLTARMAEGS